MRFWLTIVLGVFVVTGLTTAIYVVYPELRSAPVVEETPPEPKVPTGPVPKAVATTLEHSVDNIPQMYQGFADFEIRNEGGADLDLTPTAASCTCASSELIRTLPDGTNEYIKFTASDERKWQRESNPKVLSHMVLKPGEKATLRLGYDTKDRVGEYSVRAPVQLLNDPKAKVLNFTLKLLVQQDLKSTEDGCHFGVVHEGSTAKKELLLFSTIHENLTFGDPVPSSKSFTVTFTPMTSEELASVKAKSGVRVTVQLQGGLPVGYFGEKFDFETSLKRGSRRNMAVTGMVEGSLVLVPTQVDFGVVTAGVAHEKRVEIFAKGLPEGDVLSVGTIEPTFLEAKITSPEPKLKVLWRLMVTIPPSAAAGSFTGNVAIVDKSGSVRLNLAVRGSVADSQTVSAAK